MSKRKSKPYVVPTWAESYADDLNAADWTRRERYWIKKDQKGATALLQTQLRAIDRAVGRHRGESSSEAVNRRLFELTEALKCVPQLSEAVADVNNDQLSGRPLKAAHKMLVECEAIIDAALKGRVT